jgi:hypothetical protein
MVRITISGCCTLKTIFEHLSPKFKFLSKTRTKKSFVSCDTHSLNYIQFISRRLKVCHLILNSNVWDYYCTNLDQQNNMQQLGQLFT